MSTLKTVWNCMFGPRLIKIYGNEGPVEKFYQPHSFEKWGDQVIHSLYVIWKIGVYTSPFLVGILYQRGYFTVEELGPFTKLVTSISVILIVSYCCKGLGRFSNPTYLNFLSTLEAARKELTPESKQQLSLYDFDFHSWPVEFDMRTLKKENTKTFINKPVLHQNVLQYVTQIPFRIIAYVAIHTFGIRLIYPGTIGIIQMILEQSLLQGRSRLIEHNQGERYKLRTCDNNDIDTMFIDRRKSTQNGNTLVICSEGNAGFYEIGIMITAIEAGYSTLGWNHPGFGGSTGKPFPTQEQNAVDAVLQFAIYKLGFKPENIILFGWSIGGYATSWAAMNYPDVKGVIVDATFDDLLPLALNHMPSWWESIVKLAIREYINLNVFEHLAKYPGPILIIRRTEDEVICLRENELSSNRGNDLLIKLLRARYPYIFEDRQIDLLKHYLSVTSASQDLFLKKYNVNENVCNSLLQTYISEYSKSFPMKIGEDFQDHDKNQMALFLARKYMKDFKATHCTNLPAEMFQPPWAVNVEFDFVFT
ncbi:phosphatidylserine lipase ABHD16A [Tribolium madens]|uniref:phosphatidylserine lipase ABHD16A n=1 Tax=Tribolium madens TaxID=41895 RepID=UPI001CF753D5|nr:phosphatidylserine lipase ABHD16A [Tribolium madens]